MRLQFEGSLAVVRSEMEQFLGLSQSVSETKAKKEKPAESKPAEEVVTKAPVDVAPTLQTVKVMITTLIAKFGKEKTKEWFTTNFAPATKPTEVPEAKYKEFVTKANEALK